MNIYVGNLPHSVTDDELRQAFEEFGTVESANVIKDKSTGQSKGFGFVLMPSQDEADAAIDALNERDFKGRTISVAEAKPRTENRGRGGFGRRGGFGGGRSGGGRPGGSGRSGGSGRPGGRSRY